MNQKDDFKKWQTDIKIAMVDEIIDVIGTEAFQEGQLIPERTVHVSHVNIIQRTCMSCGAVITGPDYNVWHILSAHMIGHRLESEQMEFNFSVGDDDDDDGGVPV